MSDELDDDELESLINKAVPLPKGIDKDRLTLTLNLVHQPRGEQPSGLNIVTSKLLETSEELYTRRITVGPEWQPIRLGDFPAEKVGRVAIYNLEGKGLSSQPSPEEKALAASKIVEVAYLGDDKGWLVEPGWPFTGCPSDVLSIRLRCLQGEARCRLYLFPK